MMEAKQLLKQLWKIEADDTSDRAACRFQLQTEAGPTECTACSKAILLDYAPAKTLTPGKLYKITGYELKKLDDASKVMPEVMLCEESLTLQNDDDIERFFLPLNNWQEVGLGVFDRVGEQMVLHSIMPYLKSGSFQFAGLALHLIPDQVRWEINKNSSLTQLNARIGKMRTGPVMVLLLSCDTAMLIVTLSKIQAKEPENNNIFMGADNEAYRLDGLREDGSFTRLVKGKNTLKGLANPVARNKAADTPPPEAPVAVEQVEQPVEAVQEEPQVEDVQPEQAEAIAAAAPEVEQPEQAPVEAVKEEPKKRTRMKRPANVKQDNEKIVGLLDDLITYFSAPIPEWMTVELMQTESRKLRDLGVAIARRQSNLFTAATASEKKLRDVLKGVLG